jgi:hypothetical protein
MKLHQQAEICQSALLSKARAPCRWWTFNFLRENETIPATAQPPTMRLQDKCNVRMLWMPSMNFFAPHSPGAVTAEADPTPAGQVCRKLWRRLPAEPFWSGVYCNHRRPTRRKLALSHAFWHERTMDLHAVGSLQAAS